MQSSKARRMLVPVGVFVAVLVSASIALMLATNDSEEAHPGNSPKPPTAVTETTTASPTSTSMSPLEAQESRKTFKNSVNALGWGVMDAATVDQQAQIVYGDIMFDDCKLTIVAPLRNEESPEAILGTTLDAPDHLPLELGGYLELRTRLNNEPDLVTKLGWQDCWLEPAG